MRRERWVSMTGERQAPVPAPVPFWPKPLSIFGLPEVTTLSTRAPVCTIPPIPPPLRLMLAETPSPHGAGASRVTVGTMSAGAVRVVTLPHICVGDCGWHSRSGRYNMPDNHPCDLVSQCLLRTAPFRSRLLTL